MDSILNTNKHECFICHANGPMIECHHIYGAANRRLSEDYGLKVYLCYRCHRSKYGVHQNRDLMDKLHRIGQIAYMEHYDQTEDEFRQIFGKSYL